MNKYLKVSTSILVCLVAIGVLVYFEIMISNLLRAYLNKYLVSIFSLHIPILIYFLTTFSLRKMFKIEAKTYGFSKKAIIKKISIGLLIGFSILAISTLVLLISNSISIHFSITSFDSIFFTLISSIIVGSWEEMFFRGFLNTLFANCGLSFIGIVFLSSLVFSAVHIMSFNPADTSYLWFFGIFFMGILFSILYKKFNSIFVPIGLHIVWDFISFGLVGRNDFKGFYIDNFQSFSKQMDNIETIVVFVLIFVLFVNYGTNLKKIFSLNLSKRLIR